MYVLYVIDNEEFFQSESGSSVALDSGIVVHIKDETWLDAEIDDYIETTFSTALGEHTIRAVKSRFKLLYGVG
jgi:hypothetical protein